MLRTLPPRFALGLVVAAMLGCGGAPVPDPEPTVDVVRVSVPTATLDVGSEMQVTALALDESGASVAAASFAWAIEPEGPAQLQGDGATATLLGVEAGAVTVSATSSGVTGTAAVTIAEAAVVTVATVRVEPAIASILQGGTARLTATPLDAAGNTLSGRVTTWSSSNGGVATVTASGDVQGVAAGNATVRAEIEGRVGTASITVSAIPVATLELVPASGTLTAGSSLQLTATARDASGNILPNRFTTWQSSNSGVATVSPTGWVTGTAPGTATISATAEGRSAGAAITVTAVPVASVTVAPASASVSVGQTVQLGATPRDASGNVLTGRTVTWSSSAPGVATVSTSGLVSTVGAGSATVTATSEGRSGSASITVSAVSVASVTVAPASASVTVGQTVQLGATLRDGSGNVLPGRPVTWTSSATGVATVSASGLVTSVGTGSATITAASEGRSGSASITVSAVSVASVTVAPASASVTVGQTVQLGATLRDGSGNVLPGRPVTWTSSATGVATVSASGLVTSVGTGSATITATSEGRSGSASITVSAVPVASVTVAPASASVNVGQTVQLGATLRDGSGNVLTGRPVTWSSSAPGVATVSTAGLVSGQGLGSATITATSEGRSGSASITVTAVPVASVTVAPASASVTVGQAVQLGATLRDGSGNVLTGRPVTWSSSAPGVATVSTAGLVSGQGLGSATITATSEGQGGTSFVTVTASSTVNYALRFEANVLNDMGRVKIALDAPHRPVDVGTTDFTIEFWIRGRGQDNTESLAACGAGSEAWIEGNIVLDRDRFSRPRDWGLALGGGRVAFGVRNGSDAAYTICGTTNLLDDQWHHVAVTRRVGSGELQVFVDGQREALATGPTGDISYPDNFNCTGICTAGEAFLVLSAEKHDVGPQYPGFRGQLDELRLSTMVRYSANFTRPSQRFVTDGSTAALYHFDEGQGTTLGDTSGAAGGPSHGTLRVGGSPAGPTWVPSSAPTGD